MTCPKLWCVSGMLLAPWMANSTTSLDAQEVLETAFLSRVENAVARFASVRTAMDAGYRKLGPDFPGMGEHWIHPGLVIEGALHPARPPVLCFTKFGAERRLVGVAYTRVLAPDESPPIGPFPPEAWHDHTGGVDEESLILSGPASLHTGDGGFRLAMVHVWVPVANPDGVLQQNNWALPFRRAGLPVPLKVSREAARALSLGGGGLAFYEYLLASGLELRGKELERTSAAFSVAGRRADAWTETREPRDSLTSADLAGLEEIWTSLWQELEAALPPHTYERLLLIQR